MANKLNKELQEQIRLRKEILKLSYQEQEQFDNSASTLQSRTDILQKIAAVDEKNLSRSEKQNKLSDIQSQLEEKITYYKEIGHTVQADSFQLEKDLLKMKQDKLEAEENVNKTLKEAGDSLLGGLITKGEQLAETMKKPGGILVVGLTAALALLLTFSKTTDKIGEKFGAIGVTDFAQDLREANISAAELGRNISDVSDSLQELADNFGVSAIGSKDTLNSVTELSVMMGLTNQEGAKLLGTLKTMLGLSDSQAVILSKQTALLAKQEGLIPTTVMKDMAEASEAVAKFAKQGGENISKAAIQARKLGINLDTAAKIADGLLDFENSITKEMELSVLLGKQISFQRARVLALNGDISGAMRNILTQLGGEAEFNRLLPMQRQAMADALGVSVAEMSKFVRLQGKSKNEMSALTDMKIDELVAKDAISNITLLNNIIKKIGANIQAAIGGFAKFMGITAESSTGADLLKIALVALGAGLIFIGVSALASALKIKLMSKIIGKSGKGLAKFAATGSAAIPLLLTIAGVGLVVAAVIASIGFAIEKIGSGMKMLFEGMSTLFTSVTDSLVSIGQNLSIGMVLKIGALALALTGLAAALTLVGVAGLFALPALMALSWFGLLPSAPVGDQPGGEAAGGTEGDTKVQSVFDKTLDEKVALLQEEMTGFREDMKKYFGSGGTVFPEFQKSTQNALENAS